MVTATGEKKHEPTIHPMPMASYPEIDENDNTTAVGRRKRAEAKVTLRSGTGKITINGRHWVNYIPELWRRNRFIDPLVVSQTMFNYDISVECRGGGFSGQIDAARMGLARAISRRDPELRYTIKRAGLLTRDPRKVERKKAGRKKARKKRQWVKR